MNHGRIYACTVAYVLFFTAFFNGGATAQAGPGAGKDDEASVAQTCLEQRRIRRTEIVNNRNIAFITKDDTIYNNELPRECPTLWRRSVVNYPVAGRAICAGSLIQVLQQTGGGQYTPTFTCQLGNFVPITRDELDSLAAATSSDADRRRSRRRSTREAVTSEQVELPPPAEPAAPAPPTE